MKKKTAIAIDKAINIKSKAGQTIKKKKTIINGKCDKYQNGNN